MNEYGLAFLKLILGGTMLGGLFVAARYVWVAYIQRNNARELRVKRTNINGQIDELTLLAHSVEEENAILEHFTTYSEPTSISSMKASTPKVLTSAQLRNSKTLR